MAPQAHTEQTARLTIRIMWGALTMGVSVFTIVALVVNSSRQPTDDNAVADMVFYVSLGMLLAGLAVGIFARGQIFKQGWQGNVVTPDAYVRGTLLQLSMIEGAALAGAVSLMLGDTILPYIISPAIGIVLLSLSFPTGKPMQPTTPDMDGDNPYAQR